MSTLVLDLLADPSALARVPAPGLSEAERLRLADLRQLGGAGALRRLRARRYRRCVVAVNDFRAQGRWASVIALALTVRADERVLMDPTGTTRPLGWRSAVRKELPFALRRGLAIQQVRREAWRGARAVPPAGARRAVRPERALFVRADISVPLTAGGSLAHIRGVIGGLEDQGVAVSFLTPGPVAGFEPDGERVVQLPPDPRHRLSIELPALAYNRALEAAVVEQARRRGADLVYHRYALGCYGAAAAARALDLPLVVEFNGSEVWISKQWGEGLEHPELMEEIERRTLRAADLVVAVSEPLREPLRAAGVPDDRVLVNPNGVDPDRFDPERLAPARAAHRARLGVRDEHVVVGFVGTFGAWHGAEMLARAAARVGAIVGGVPVHYLLIGEGPRRREAEATVAHAGIGDAVTFTGLVPQDETPGLLAACDVAVAPHVPNADGTPFFGSPTKLFEYMASGRAIVASALDQIGEVLEDEVTALMVAPGDERALAAGLIRIVSDPPLRARLARAARERAVSHHSWRAHVGRMLARLAEPPA
jgi:glycosyltransferase involved in cell wall biosynthesis